MLNFVGCMSRPRAQINKIDKTILTMKYLTKLGLAILVLTMLTIAGCEQEKPMSDGENFVKFSASNHTLGIIDSEEWFEIPVVAEHNVDHSQNLGVEVIVSKSSAIEDKHFVMETHTLTIEAGKKTSSVRIRGIADAIMPNSPVEIKLRLVVNEGDIRKKSDAETTITLQRCCPFDINNFAGYAVLTSTWSMQYMNTESTLVRTHADEKEEGVIVIEDMFYEDYDIRVRLHTDDRLNPIAELCGAQVLGSTGEAFGTIYGNGKLMMGAAPAEYVSYYSTCEGFLLLYTEMYVEEVGTVGYFGHILEWISDDEAERIMREGF